MEDGVMVDRNHHFPAPDAPRCVICSDSGLYCYDGRWYACRAPHAIEQLEAKMREAAEANASLDMLEKRVGVSR
jgi:hypothetical protein